MPPTWNLDEQLKWIHTSKPYIPKFNSKDIPDLTPDQIARFKATEKTTINKLSQLNRSNTFPLSNTDDSNQIRPSSRLSNLTNINNSKLINKVSNQFISPTEINNTSTQINTNIINNNNNIKKKNNQLKGQIEITELIQKRSLLKSFNNNNANSSNDSFIDLTQDIQHDEPIISESKKRKLSNDLTNPSSSSTTTTTTNTTNNNKKLKQNDFDDTDVFSDEEVVEAILAERESSEKSPPLINNLNNNQNLIDFCIKQSNLISHLKSLNEFLEKGINIETSTSLSEDQKRHERKNFNPKLQDLKFKCNSLFNEIPNINDFLNSIKINNNNIPKTPNIINENTVNKINNNNIKDNNNDSWDESFDESFKIFENTINNKNLNDKTEQIQKQIQEQEQEQEIEIDDFQELDDLNDLRELERNENNINEEKHQNDDEYQDADDTDIIIHNSNPIKTTTLLSSSLQNENYSRPKRNLQPTIPINNQICSTQDDEIEDSFNCESENEPETKTQIQKEMGNFVIHETDNSSIDESYNETAWNSDDNELDEIEEINNSDIIQLHNSDIDDTNNSEFEDNNLISNSNKIHNNNSISNLSNNIDLSDIDINNDEIDDVDTQDNHLVFSDALDNLPIKKKPTICISDGINEFDQINSLKNTENNEDNIIIKNEISEKSNNDVIVNMNTVQAGEENGNDDDDEEDDDEIMIIDNMDDYFTQLDKERGIEPKANNEKLDDDFWDINDAELFKKLEDNPAHSSSNTDVGNKSIDEIEELKNPNKNDFKEYHGKHEWTSEIYKALKNTFKLHSFRDNQLNAINATLSGDDVFVLMPTGGGKSLCYQLPAIIKSGVTSGVTIVISPLISLMEDQVSHLLNMNIKAAMLNSKMALGERKSCFARFIQGDIDLMYLSPEMISKSEQSKRAIKSLYDNGKLARIVIDEAHCVSAWGHDFRPDYKQLKFFKTEYPDIPMMALTATANTNVRSDIIEQLGLKNPKFFKQSFNRVNLFYQVLRKEKCVMEDICSLIREKYPAQTGIIYCSSKNLCEVTAKRLSDFGVSCDYYHAGLEPDERTRVQKQWQEGSIKVIAATVAFGMGIDKGDVRFVIHLNLPRNLEGYYQETGRAGRDGKPSDCIMFYSMKDARVLQGLIRKDRDLDSFSKRKHLDNLKSVVEYCENYTDCRRKIVLHYFSEKFDRKDCHKQCDNCLNLDETNISYKDMTEVAKLCVGLVKEVSKNKVTIHICQDILKGSKQARIIKYGLDKTSFYGSAKEITKTELERVFFHLGVQEFLQERPIKNGGPFASNYVFLGKNAKKLLDGNTKFILQITDKKPGLNRNNNNYNNNKNSNKPIPLSKQTSFRPSSELWNGNINSNNGENFENKNNRASSRIFDGSGSNVRFNAKGIQVSTITLKDPQKKHLDDCYQDLRKERSLISNRLDVDERTLASDSMLKDMSLKLPINQIVYNTLDDFKPHQEKYFERFIKKIKELRGKRMKLFDTLDLTSGLSYDIQDSAEGFDITEDSVHVNDNNNNNNNNNNSNTRSRFFSLIESNKKASKSKVTNRVNKGNSRKSSYRNRGSQNNKRPKKASQESNSKSYAIAMRM